MITVFSYFPCDPPYITDDVREARSFKNAMENLKSQLDNLQKDLNNSVPFFSSRYKVTLYTVGMAFCVLHVQGITARSREIRLSEFAFIQLKSDEKGKNKIIHSPIYASSE